ncbi:hypothetical protein D0X99_12955 [Algoriphagus lacus]|uniref:Lipoprotein n=1 Tax=Algoriphagus lacus TaxID=2056311 RepID=A0A418PQ82_9BACT|nr:hypothetical protein [Algoriphagus lacus]RIW14464.1 hypothetical protein D0X99_12955 [Algoriphagus lacus]
MVWIHKFKSWDYKKAWATVSLCLAYLSVLVLVSCIEEPEFNEGCPAPKEADAVSIKQVFFSPYKNQRFASSADTVAFSEFRFNFELEIKEKEAMNSGSLPGQAFALSCIQTYNLRNISNISVILLAPFAGLPTGTDISYLLITPEGEKISELRDFQNVSVYFGSKLNITPSNYSQLKTRTFLFLRNGTQKVMDSTSPFLKTN